MIVFLENEKFIKAEPQNIKLKKFNQDVEQRVFLSMTSLKQVTCFPIWNVNIGEREIFQNIRLSLPFTINKFAECESLSVNNAIDYLENVV